MKSTRRSFFLVIVILLLLASVQLACGLGGSASPGPGAVNPTQAVSPTRVPDLVMPPSITEARMLTLEYPPKIRAGDSDVVRLTLEVDDNGNLTATASSAGNVTSGQVVVIPNLYDTHNVMAEARLDLAGAEVRPSETVSETLLPGQKVTFFWSVLPAEAGKYRGTVWFYLRFIPRDGGAESRQAISAQAIEIEATSFFGLAATPARWLGVAGSLLSSVLGFPFLESILKWLWNRRRSQ